MYTHMQRNSEESPSDIYNGAFAYTSPPEKILLSDSTNNAQTISPFNSKYNVLKFNSANKSGFKKKKTGGHMSNGSSQKKGFNFKTNKSDKLMDFKIEEQILGRGIFSNGTNQDDA